MLTFTNMNLKIISDIEKYQFIVSTIRYGISMICKECAEANNRFLNTYNADKPTSYIINLDASNLYRHSMMQLFSTEILDWFNAKDFNLDSNSNDGLISCFLDVNFDYPAELYDLHNNYPSGGKIQRRKEMFSALSITNFRR